MSTPHVHACPKCYERPVCTMECTIVPDLGTTPDGTPYGYPDACDRCGSPDLAAAIRELSPTMVFEAPRGSLTLAHLHRGEDR